MFLIDMLFAFVIALIVAGILTSGFGRRGPGPLSGFIFFFVMLFFFIWALGIWIEPVGPMVGGVPWLTFAMVGLVAALLLAAVTTPGRTQRNVPETPVETAAEEAAVATVFTVFFWLLLIALLFAIVVNYAMA